VSLILSGAAMLRHVGHYEEADKITHLVLSGGKVLTPDLGGTTTTRQLADIIARIIAK
jgi:isocitrate/isopropylmalate dehydrogenase